MHLFYISTLGTKASDIYKGKHKISDINFDDIDSRFDCGILHIRKREVETISHNLELKASVPYIVVAKGLKSEEQRHGVLNNEIISEDNIEDIDNIISSFFNKKTRNLSIFELTDIMQLIQMDRKDVAVKIKSTKKKYVAVIVFENGEPVYAQTHISSGVLEGEDAIYQVLLWKTPKIKFYNLEKKVKRNVNTPLMNLLMEGMRIKDENTLSVLGLSKETKEELEQKLTSLFGDFLLNVLITKKNQVLYSKNIENDTTTIEVLSKFYESSTKFVEAANKDQTIARIVISSNASVVISHEKESDIYLMISLSTNISSMYKVSIDKFMLYLVSKI